MEGFKSDEKRRCDGPKKKKKKMPKIYDCRVELLKHESPFPLEGDAKIAAWKASPSIVSVVTRNLPKNMCLWHGSKFHKGEDTEIVFAATGTIIECKLAGDGRYSSTIIVPATVFVRDDGTRPKQVKVDVYMFNGNVYHGKVLACDFNYNLAAVRIKSDAPLQAAVFRGFRDMSYLEGTHQDPHLSTHNSFQLRPHSDLHNLFPGSKITALVRSFVPPFRLLVDSGVFRTHHVASTLAELYTLDCKELYWLKGTYFEDMSGAPLINCFGEVIGIMFCKSAFLPSNFVSRWWNHYSTHRKFRQPWVGLETINLHVAHKDFLEQLTHKFPDTDSSVVVTKVQKDSPAYHSGVRLKDVIFKCGGQLVRSNLEFFEYIWDHAGEPMELTVLRVENGRRLNLSMTTEQLTSDMFNKWPLPDWWTLNSENVNAGGG